MNEQVKKQNLKKLQIRIGNCKAVLEDDEEDSNSHYLLSQTLIEAGDLHNDEQSKSYYDEAEQSLNKAIDLEENALYLVKKIQLCYKLGKKEAIPNDIIRTLKAGSSGNDNTDKNVKDILRDIMKDVNIKNDIEKMINDNMLFDDIKKQIHYLQNVH